jgi:hypothetical protein
LTSTPRNHSHWTPASRAGGGPELEERGKDTEAALLGIVEALAAELRPGRAPVPATLESRLDQDLGSTASGGSS